MPGEFIYVVQSWKTHLLLLSFSIITSYKVRLPEIKELLRPWSLTDVQFCFLRIGMERTQSDLLFQVVQIQNDMIPDVSSLLVSFTLSFHCRMLVFLFATHLPSIVYAWRVIPLFNEWVTVFLCVHSSCCEWSDRRSYCVFHESALSSGNCYCGKSGLSAVWHWYVQGYPFNVGSALMKTILEEARKEHMKEVVLHISNIPSLKTFITCAGM